MHSVLGEDNCFEGNPLKIMKSTEPTKNIHCFSFLLMSEMLTRLGYIINQLFLHVLDASQFCHYICDVL